MFQITNNTRWQKHNTLQPGGYGYVFDNTKMTLKLSGDNSEIILTPTDITLMLDHIGKRIEVTGIGYLNENFV